MALHEPEIHAREEEPERLQLDSHLVGVHDLGRPGPLFVFVGGMHGNEPAGVHALRRVLAELEREQLALNGRLVCFAGHLSALRLGERYLDRDLNRIWGREDLAAGDQASVHETVLRKNLLQQIEAEIVGASEPVVFLDLHSTSAGGSPFSIIGDTRQNRRIAFALPVPVILGLEENVDGALLGYFGERGHVAVGFEGGQHEGPETVDNHVAAIWLTLITAGGLDAGSTPQGRPAFERLRAAGRGLPGVVELRYRHHVEARDEFVMRAGFANFDPVRKGEDLAQDARGAVHCAEDGLILLPLYQGQGQDGFFIGREVRRFWLRVSSLLRALRLDRIVHWLPGIRRLPGARDTLVVDSQVARWWVIEIFHLLGFRRRRPVQGKLRFSRRVEGIR
jgi:succinylglutamate desuccinylase